MEGGWRANQARGATQSTFRGASGCGWGGGSTGKRQRRWSEGVANRPSKAQTWAFEGGEGISSGRPSQSHLVSIPVLDVSLLPTPTLAYPLSLPPRGGSRQSLESWMGANSLSWRGGRCFTWGRGAVFWHARFSYVPELPLGRDILGHTRSP